MTQDSNSLFQTAEQYLLAPYALTTGQLSGVFGEMFGHRLDAADLYFQFSRSEAWSLEEGIVKSGSFNIEQGVGVRAISGEKTAFAYSDEISMPALLGAARATRAIAAAGGAGSVPCYLGVACRLSMPPPTRSVRWPTQRRSSCWNVLSSSPVPPIGVLAKSWRPLPAVGKPFW